MHIIVWCLHIKTAVMQAARLLAPWAEYYAQIQCSMLNLLCSYLHGAKYAVETVATGCTQQLVCRNCIKSGNERHSVAYLLLQWLMLQSTKLPWQPLTQL